MSGNIEKVNALTQEQREEALHRARLRIAGPEPEPGREPTLDDFLKRGSGKYPPSVTRWIRGLAVVMLGAAFLPSAIRLHEIGRTTFGQSITDAFSVYTAALCIVLMAEIGQVIFSLAAATTAESTSRIPVIRAQVNWQRMGLRFGALTCTLIALAGNAEVVKPWNHGGVFVWLETFAPPILVLVTAQVLKTQMLHAIEDRHAAQLAYADAHADWQADYAMRLDAWQEAYARADEQPDWMRQAANALRDALRAANRRSYAVMRSLTHEEWYELIQREMRADQWYVRVDAKVQREAVQAERTAQAQTIRAGASGGTHTGETADQVRFDGARDVWVAECPHCDYVVEKDTERGAVNALAAHVGRWCKVRNVRTQDVMESAMRGQYADATGPVAVDENGRES